MKMNGTQRCRSGDLSSAPGRPSQRAGTKGSDLAGCVSDSGVLPLRPDSVTTSRSSTYTSR